MGLLADLLSAVAARLRASDLISATPAIEVVQEDRGDIDAAIAKAVGKTGIVVSVSIPSGRPSGLGRGNHEIEVLVEILENVPINRGPAGSQRTSTEIMDDLVAMCLDWRPLDYWTPMEWGGFDQVAPGTPTVTQFRLLTTTTVEVIHTPDPE